MLQWWHGLSEGQKRLVIMSLGGVAIAFAILIAVPWGGARYSGLYSNLSSDDLAAVCNELSKSGIPFKVDERQNRVLVPSDMAARARMILAEAGLPRTGSLSIVGFELFDRTSFGMPELVQRTNYLRALQGELARSIMALEPVQHARVHLTLPQPTIFEERQKEPTASVVLQLRNGHELSAEQAKAIVFLVARSVEGLKPENVFLTDTSGRLLWVGDNLQGTELSQLEDQLRLKAQFERMLENKLQNLLDRTLGVGKGFVKVSAELDTEKREAHSELVVPQSGGRGIPVSMHEITETYRAQGLPQASGIPGSSSNLGLVTTGSYLPGIGGTYTRREMKAEYQLSKRMEKLVRLPGSVKRLSISVWIEEQLPSALVSSLTDALASAAGARRDRGDSITVFTFPPRRLEKPREEKLVRAGISHMSRLLWAVGVPLMLFGMLIPFLAAWLRKKRGAVPPAPATKFELPQVELPHVKEKEALPGAMSEIEELRRYAKEHPEEVANLIRSWLASNDGDGK